MDWHKMFEKYSSIVDWPGCRFYEELMEVYPEAKVILTIRNFDAWYESALNTIYKVCTLKMPWMTPPSIKRLREMADNVIWQGTFKGRFLDREFVRSVYEEHIAQVKRTVPPHKLLIFEVKQGWEPLCKFLGLPVPSVPFPRVNDAAEFEARLRQITLVITTLKVVVRTTIVIFVLFICYLIYSYLQ